MARSKAAKEAADKERKAIRAQLKLKKDGENGTEDAPQSHDIGLPEERKKDAIEQKLAAAFKKRGWTAVDDDGVLIGIVPKGTDMDDAAGKAKEDADALGYHKSYGIRQTGYNASGKKKAVEEIEETEEEEDLSEEDDGNTEEE